MVSMGPNMWIYKFEYNDISIIDNSYIVYGKFKFERRYNYGKIIAYGRCGSE